MAIAVLWRLETTLPWAGRSAVVASLGAGMGLLGLYLWSRPRRQALPQGATNRAPRATPHIGATEAEFRAIFEAAGTGKAVVDVATGLFVRVNVRLCKFTGYTEEELIGRPYLLITHSNDRPTDKHAFELMARDQLNEYTVEKRFVCKNGDVTWGQLTATALRNTQGEQYAAVFVIQDLTEHKAAMDELRRGEERLRQALEANRCGIWEWDVRRNQVTWSDRIYEFHGLKPGEFDGTVEAYVALIAPEDQPRVHTALQRALDQKEPYNIEFRAARPDGEERWLSTSARTFYAHDGQPTRMVGAVFDCTQRRRTEAMLKAAKEAADAANQAKTTFLANMSHEIRTPLGAIIGFTEFLQDPAQTPADRQECVAAIRRNGELLSDIVNDVLDLSKIEADRLELECVPFSLPELVTDVSASLGLRAREKGVHLTIAIAADMPERIASDPTRLKQIMVNVVGNAVKFTERGQVDVELACEPAIGRDAAGERRLLVITVRDTGTGLSDEQRLRLFQTFSQADSSTTRKYGGTGLGLVLSRKLARALGGELSLQHSELGVGSVFVIRVEIRIPAQQAERAPAPAPVGAARKPLTGMRVLVVEDAPDNQLLIGRILKQAGASVSASTNGVEGVEAALSGDADFVLMDVQMPGGLDGYQATALLRRRGFTRPIVALTAHALAGERQRALDAGCDGYLTKPIKSVVLVETIKRLLEPDAAPRNDLEATVQP